MILQQLILNYTLIKTLGSLYYTSIVSIETIELYDLLIQIYSSEYAKQCFILLFLDLKHPLYQSIVIYNIIHTRKCIIRRQNDSRVTFSVHKK